MTVETIEQLPRAVRDVLPVDAQAAFLKTYLEAGGGSEDPEEQPGENVAIAKAWEDVRLQWRKPDIGKKWVKLPKREIGKAGARHSKTDMEMLQNIHDHAVKLGADCGTEDKKKSATKMAAEATLVKVDDELGLVFGFAIVCKIDGEPYFDVQDDHIPEDAMLKASFEFMSETLRVAKEMHLGVGKGMIVFAWPMTTDIADAMGIATRKTGLMIAAKFEDPAITEKFRSGEYRGFSIGGQRVYDEVVEE